MMIICLIGRQQTKRTWIVRLLSVACLSIAAKVEETNVPLSIELQVRVKNYLIDQQKVLQFLLFSI